MPRRVLFDVTRLAWRARRASPTGIDRVVMAYARWLDGCDDLIVTPVALAGARLVEVPHRRYRQLLDSSEPAPGGPMPHDDAWSRLRVALSSREPDARAVRRPILANPAADWLPLGLDMASRWLRRLWGRAPTGDIYLNVSHTGLHRPGLLSGLAARGVAPVVMVHDLIPITHPEFCAPGAGERHRLRMDSVVEHAALVIANSTATASALEGYATDTRRPAPKTITAWLGIERAFSPSTASAPEAARYFVCVGTIEARKNLAFLLTVWRRLAETMGAAAPHLVLVGRRGWENEAVIDHLERSPKLETLVHEIADLSDEHLAALIAGARALLAPSLVEGFDLPPLEGLAMGVPVIASDIDVHRELATGARLIDPLDGPGWIAAITEAATTPATASVGFAPPDWASHFRAVELALADLPPGRASRG